MPYRNYDKIGSVVVDYTYYSGVDLYSEGAAEDRLLDYVKNHTALDYERHIQESRSWSVMYHLSYIRENIVSWLPIGPGDRVLEIGSGCGAVRLLREALHAAAGAGRPRGRVNRSRGGFSRRGRGGVLVGHTAPPALPRRCRRRRVRRDLPSCRRAHRR